MLWFDSLKSIRIVWWVAHQLKPSAHWIIKVETDLREQQAAERQRITLDVITDRKIAFSSCLGR